MRSHADTSDLPQVYAELMKTDFAPVLRSAGLRGSNGRFELPSRTCWALIGFQRSTSNTASVLRFTLNVSAIDRDAWEREVATRPYLGERPSPNITYGPWAEQRRIGQLTPAGEDKWWRLSPDTAPTGVRDDVLADLARYAVPWLRERAHEHLRER